jgi:hypothetical protein
MTAAHEIGAAVGVAVFSAAGVAVTGGVAAGCRHGFAVAAAVAAGLAVTGAVLSPRCGPLPARRWRCTDVPPARHGPRHRTRATPASYHRQIADRNAQAILDAAEELLRLEGHTSISAVAALAGSPASPSTRTSRPGRPCWKRRCSAR